jgi:hypothetical protein
MALDKIPLRNIIKELKDSTLNIQRRMADLGKQFTLPKKPNILWISLISMKIIYKVCFLLKLI